MNISDLMSRLGVDKGTFRQGEIVVDTPIDGSEIGRAAVDDPAAVEARIAKAQKAFCAWRTVPAPRRGELVRLLGEELRAQ